MKKLLFRITTFAVLFVSLATFVRFAVAQGMNSFYPVNGINLYQEADGDYVLKDKVGGTTIGQLSNAGALTVPSQSISGNLTFTAASAKIIPGATELLIRNNADSTTNVSVTNAGRLAALTMMAGSTSVTPQAGAKVFAYSGGSGAGAAPTNLEIVSIGSGNGGYDNAGPDASTRGYYFSNVSAAYDGGIEYASRAMSFKTASTARMSISSAGNVLIGSGSADTNAILTLTSTTKALLLPRMTSTERANMAGSTAGMIVYDTTLGKLVVKTAGGWEAVTSV